MDRWKAELGRGREKRRVEERRSKKRKSQKKADADARKSRKVAKHCVFPMICGSAGSNSRLAKAAGAEPAGQMGDEKLHAIVARSTFPSQMYKTHHCRTTFGGWDVEKVHTVVARSIFASENVQNTPLSNHFWKLRCRKSARRCGAKHMSKSKCTKHTMVGPLLEVEMSKKCTPLWREAHFQVKMYKTLGVRTTFGGSDVVSRGRRKGLCTSSKGSKTWRFCSISKNDGRHGTFEEDLQRWIFVAGAVQKTCSWEMLGGQGADYLRGVAFWSIRCAGLLRWFCVTGAALGMTWHQSSVACAVLCTQLSIFEGSLAEFFRFWCFELRKMRKSRRIASFRMLSSSKNEDVSQNCFVLDVVMFKH